MRRLAGPLLVGPLAAFGLVVSGLLPAATQPPSPAPAAAGVPAARATTTCTDVLLLAVRGSGEGAGAPAGAQFGPTLDRVRSTVADRVRAHDRSFAARTVAIVAPGPAQLKRDSARRSTAAVRAVSAGTVGTWARGVDAAAAAVVDDLVGAAGRCPDQQVVLAGYAQGAMAVHRALLTLQQRPEVASRIASVVLVADADRTKAASQVTGAPAARPGRGVAARHLAQVAAVPGAGSAVPVWNVCTAEDLVCDPGKRSFSKATTVHRGYTSGRAADKVTRAARKAGNRVARWALPPAGVVQVGAQVGLKVDQQLPVRVRKRDRVAVRWLDAQGLPAGLSLGQTGLLQGIPTAPGTFDITYTVHNSASPAYAHRAVGRLRVTVVADSALALTTGGTQTCRLQQDGTAHCWGRNNWGQFGNGTKTDSRSPAPAARYADWQELSTSGSSTCGIRADGTLWCWGLNQYGQLGDGTRTNRARPVQVGSKKWSSVSTGWSHTCGIRADGTAWCWGYNSVGQVGDGTTKLRKNPKRVAGDHGTWRTITAGGFFTCGTTAGGKGLCWGANAFGQLGNGTRTGSITPVPIGFTAEWSRIDASWYTACGLKTNGELRCWGSNEQGQLGDGTRTHRLYPALAGGGGTYRDVSVGDAHVCAIGTDDALRCWGDNTYGQLGTGSTPSLTREPVTPVQRDGWYSVEAGWLHTCGLRQDGTTWCWGNNEHGQVGDGTVADRRTAVPVA